MYSSEIQLRIRYAETDQMGYVYYGKYAEFFEVGRVESLRKLGLVYADLEKEYGILMPVASMEVKYIRPVLYDELITIKTTIVEMPNAFMKFETEIYNEDNKLVNLAKVKLAFIDSKGKRTNAPEFMLTQLKAHFEDE